MARTQSHESKLNLDQLEIDKFLQLNTLEKFFSDGNDCFKLKVTQLPNATSLNIKQKFVKQDIFIAKRSFFIRGLPDLEFARTIPERNYWFVDTVIFVVIAPRYKGDHIYQTLFKTRCNGYWKKD